MIKKFFTDVNVRDGESPVFCYRSGLTVYEEGFCDGALCSFGWNGAGFTLNVLEDFPSYLNPNEFPRPEVFSLEVNGITLRRGWVYDSFEKKDDGDGAHLVIKFIHTTEDVVAFVHTQLDGTAVLTRWVEFENVSESEMSVGSVTVMSGGLDKTDNISDYLQGEDEGKVYSVGYFEKAHHQHEGLFRWHDVENVRKTVGSRYNRNRFRHPMIMIRNNAHGTIWFAQLGYSGGYAFDVDFDTDNDRGYATMSLATRIEGDNPTYILQPGERFLSPKVHIGMMNGDLDDIVNEMHTHIRRSVIAFPHAKGMDGGWIEGGIGPERLMDFEAIKHFADTMEAVGAETLIIDAGWYCPPGLATSEWWKRVGDWDYDRELYPEGIDAIREYVHSKGLLFGMWMEVERAGELSAVYEEHPDWYITDVKGNRTTILDASNPEVIEFMEAAISHLVDDYQIDLFRLDYNVDYAQLHYRNALGENGNFRYCENLYAMFDRLREKYPDVVFENCASGGARTDLGMVSRFTHTWVSDNQRLPLAIAITNGMTMALPPEYVDRLSGGMNSHKNGSLDSIVRHALFGRPTTNSYNCMGSEMNPNQVEFVRHSYDIYKNVIRPFAPMGRIYHHTPEVYGENPRGNVILERSSEDKSAGVIGVFRLEGGENEVIVYPKGVDAGAVYEVTFDNLGATVRMRGFDMINNGVKVTTGSVMTSELVVYEKA